MGPPLVAGPEIRAFKVLSEIRSNGSTQIRLKGERPIEQIAIATILDAANKGQRIQLSAGDDPEELVIRLEHA